jgi:hypothetical protein
MQVVFEDLETVLAEIGRGNFGHGGSVRQGQSKIGA